MKIVLLQHPDGRARSSSGDVDAWAGLDPIWRRPSSRNGSRLFFRDADLNSYGFLNVREEFAAKNPAPRGPRSRGL